MKPRYTNIKLLPDGYEVETNDDYSMFRFDGLCKIDKAYSVLEVTTDEYNTIMTKKYFCADPSLLHFGIRAGRTNKTATERLHN